MLVNNYFNFDNIIKHISTVSHTPYFPLTGRLMFKVTLSLGYRGYTREVWTWSCDMEVGESGNEVMCVHQTAA